MALNLKCPKCGGEMPLEELPTGPGPVLLV
jgi:hypothetical protein